MEAIMRIKRMAIAPAILALGTVGALIAAPALTVAPAAAAGPGMVVYHGSVNSAVPGFMIYHG